MNRIVWGLIVAMLIPAGMQAAKVKALMADQQGAALEGVEALLAPTPAGAGIYGKSSKSGEIVFLDVADGTYILKARKAGYASGESAPVTVSGADASIQMKMLAQPVLEKMLEKASNAFKKKKYSDAVEQYTELFGYFPNDATVLGNLARAHQALNQPDKALEFARRAVQLDPERFKTLDKEIVATATYEAGKKYLAEKDFPKAIESFSESVKADPSYAPAFYGLALSYANKGMYPQALESVQQAIKLDPANEQYKGIEQRLKTAMGSSAK